MWDPQRYLARAAERARPFHDLISRIGATAPGTVVDLGCGPGNLTVTLAERWPDAKVIGIDSSTAMIAAPTRRRSRRRRRSSWRVATRARPRVARTTRATPARR